MEGDPGSARLRADDDGDGIINLLEVEAGWDAFAAETDEDSDNDGVPDYFEQFHFGTLEHDGSYVAVEGGLTLAEAYANATDPSSIDSDGDGWTDRQELDWGWDPKYNQSRDDDRYGPDGDFDNDGLTNNEETVLETNPIDFDTDNDGITDFNDSNPKVNFQAFPDADRDGIPDSQDSFPDDPRGDAPSLSASSSSYAPIDVVASEELTFHVSVSKPCRSYSHSQSYQTVRG